MNLRASNGSFTNIIDKEKVLKTFYITKRDSVPNSSGYWCPRGLCFVCRGDNCNNCKLKFLCFTTHGTLVIGDDNLFRKLGKFYTKHTDNYAQRKARAEFFNSSDFDNVWEV